MNNSSQNVHNYEMYTSTESILSVDHWPLKMKDMQLIFELTIVIILLILLILIITFS